MKRFLLTLFAVVCVGSVGAQSLDECRRLAREHYPEIRQYDLISQTEQYNLSNASRAWIPQVALYPYDFGLQPDHRQLLGDNAAGDVRNVLLYYDLYADEWTAHAR